MSSLTPTIVLDTSVVINLLACGDAARVLQALNSNVVVPQQVVVEITREPIGHDDVANSFPSLLQSRLLRVHELEDEHYSSFLDLVGAAAPDTLGDGEAATIATAEQLQCMAIMDERKATRVACNRRPQHMSACTLDVLSCERIVSAYSNSDLATLIFNSMYYARMRVPAQHWKWVVDLIGEERASQCSCLRRR